MTTLKKRIRIAAPPRAVHRALTDPAALQVWLAEHADVDLPDRYQFWGRFTPDGEAPHQRLRHVDDSSLRFDWELDGVSTSRRHWTDRRVRTGRGQRIDPADAHPDRGTRLARGTDGRRRPQSDAHLLGAGPGQPGRLRRRAGTRRAMRLHQRGAAPRGADRRRSARGLRVADRAGAVLPVVRREGRRRAAPGRPLGDGRFRGEQPNPRTSSTSNRGVRCRSTGAKWSSPGSWPTRRGAPG